jgi:hypothetical protein
MIDSESAQELTSQPTEQKRNLLRRARPQVSQLYDDDDNGPQVPSCGRSFRNTTFELLIT